MQDQGLGKVNLQDKYLNNVSNNPCSKKLHDDFLTLTGNVKKEIEDKYSDSSNQYQYYVMLIILSRIARGEPQQEWVQYVRDSKGKYDFKKSFVMQNLGSDLHSTPADARADVTIDGLATRLDRLRDW